MEGEKERIKVYVLDDHELVRRGLHDLLPAEPDLQIVGESGSAVRATREIVDLAPDVAVLVGACRTGPGSRYAVTSVPPTRPSAR